MPTVTRKEQEESARFWHNHLRALEQKELVSLRVLSYASFAQNPENIGYEQHQLRPGKNGQWDMYDKFMAEGFTEGERVFVSGLATGEITDSNRRIELEQRGVDPDNPREVARVAMFDAMAPEDLDAEIDRLAEELRLEYP